VWKQPWFGGDTLNTGIGQGYVLTTPLQIARMMAAVANGGTLVTPHVVTEIRGLDGKLIARIAPPPAGRVQVTQQTMAILHTGLDAVVTRGTGTDVQMPGLTVAGKTGTAEAGHGLPYAWFAAYAPVDAPRLVVVAMVENAGFGAEHALPVVKQVLQAAFGIGQTTVAPASGRQGAPQAPVSQGPATPGAPKAGQ
jgi:penicillin-binding protein 2